MSKVTAKFQNLTQNLKSSKNPRDFKQRNFIQNSAFKAFAIGPNDAPRLIGEFSKLKNIGKRLNTGLGGDR